MTMTCEKAEEMMVRIVAEPREQLVDHLAECTDCLESLAAMGFVATGEVPAAAAEALRLGRSQTPSDRNAAAPTAQPTDRRPLTFERPPIRARSTRRPAAHARRSLLAIAASVLMVVFTSLFSWQKVQAAQKATTRAEHQHLEMTEIANRAMTAAQKSDRRAFAAAVEAFDLGDIATIPRTTLSVGGTVRYPRSCPRYWLLFSEHRVAEGITVIWPQLAVRNRGLVSQEIAQRVTVPREMDAGELVLVCVDETTHERFSTWRDQTGSSPLLAPDLEIVLRTQLTIE